MYAMVTSGSRGGLGFGYRCVSTEAVGEDHHGGWECRCDGQLGVVSGRERDEVAMDVM